MQITNLKSSKHDPNRANVYIDGTYSFSLTLDQILEFKIKVGQQLTELNLNHYKQASLDGKLFGATLNYCLIRPRFISEIRSYLIRKKCNAEAIDPIILKLQNKKLLSDENAARYWVDNRRRKKGVSIRRLSIELKTKGVDEELINNILASSNRNDELEIYKIITKKYSKYDNKKLVRYLLNQGFSYDLATRAIGDYESEVSS